jgi:hypothetical protein
MRSIWAEGEDAGLLVSESVSGETQAVLANINKVAEAAVNNKRFIVVVKALVVRKNDPSSGLLVTVDHVYRKPSSTSL